MSVADWDERYRTWNFNGSGAAPLLQSTCAMLPPDRALDLACGAGRNALWLAERGWQVTAIDSSVSAVKILRDRAQLLGHTIDARIANLEAHEFDLGEQCWDLIVVNLYLQRDLFPAIRRSLAAGGVTMVVVHLGDPDDPSEFRLEPGELLRYFPGWPVLHHYEGVPTGSDRGRPVAELVVRRVASP